jgi:uncharacterized protein YceH (UPF0502 family)
MSTRIPRRLDPVEIRVLGSLLEKEQATPEAYPLSLNALVAACNQRTNRDPVMELSDAEVSAALDRLRQEVLVWRTEGARTERWKQSVERRWELDAPAKALVTLLLLRGAQTAGELRSRSDRLHAFSSLAEVEATLRRLAAAPEPLVRELSRRPGQKETRWIHLVGDLAETAPGPAPGAWEARPAAPAPAGTPPSISGSAGTVLSASGLAAATAPSTSGPAGSAPARSVPAGTAPSASGPAGTAPSTPGPAALATRLERLEEVVARLAADLEELRRRLS